MVEERRTTSEDIRTVALEDRADGFNFSSREIENLLLGGMRDDLRTTSYFAGGELLAISGIRATGLIGDTAHIWMVSTGAVERHSIAFIRHAKKILADIPYSRVTCFCDPSFLKTIRWLKREGFVPLGAITIQGRPFTSLERYCDGN